MDPLQTIMQGVDQFNNLFPQESRYHAVGTAVITAVNGAEIVYLKRRFIPPAANFRTDQLYMVKEHDRLDNIAASFVGDPEKFWQLADGNNSMQPESLTGQPGAVIHLTTPKLI